MGEYSAVEKASPKLDKFTVRHAMYCNCDACNHEQPKASPQERKRKQNYLNGR